MGGAVHNLELSRPDNLPDPDPALLGTWGGQIFGGRQPE